MSAILVSVVRGFGQFYGLLIVIYVLMSWFPMRGVLYDVYRVIGTLVEPYLGLFRRIIPLIGAVDISPIVAYFVLQLIVDGVLMLLQGGL